ncbi:hypothetical protein SUGI_0324670 [Cryptomeria japonica]|uniref:agamous-like MADS-box protein AGL66 n=1 Tax=Cryptomeria japonica TaxID=3369 RepID=UPI0024089E5A|nr:agamous-like MADS-box protein AGL66 [Cryptomeria japonica]GLJ18342.1 hypothetical protein SUGI_0324670 [Cryptomeria japonica]
MGRVKLPIKKIENNTNKQVTFSKRRNGLTKKAYELSVLCDIDIALIMFSPSGKLTHFSGKKSMTEDVIFRYVNLPDHERFRVHNQELLNGTLKKLKCEGELVGHLSSPRNEEIQREINAWRLQLSNADSRLRCLKADPHMITSVQDAEYYERVLEESLIRVQTKRQYLEQTGIVPYGQASINDQSNMQMCMQPPNGNPSFSSENQILSWVSQTSVQNFLELCKTDGVFNIRDSMVEWMRTTISPFLEQGSGSMQLGSHESDFNISHLRVDYPPHDYGSTMPIPSQCQSTYEDNLITNNHL